MCLERAYFCKNFAVLGQIPYFKNPVKYNGYLILS